MELKTLKDIFEKMKDYANPILSGIIRNDLKQEAIKEIKHFRKNRSSNLDYSKQELNGIEKYIKWKFNIKEEDLE